MHNESAFRLFLSVSDERGLKMLSIIFIQKGYFQMSLECNIYDEKYKLVLVSNFVCIYAVFVSI